MDALIAPVVALVAMFTSDGDHWYAIPNKYATYHPAAIVIPILRPIYAETPLNMAPISIPISTFLVSQ